MILVTFIIGFSKTEGTLIIKCYTFKNIQYWMPKKVVKYIQYFERMYTKKKTDLYLNIFNSPPPNKHTQTSHRESMKCMKGSPCLSVSGIMSVPYHSYGET